MTWATRLKLAVGVVVVLALCATLTLVLNRRLTQATSSQATIVSEDVAVGTDYAGTILQSFVEEGDTVAAGEPLFSLRSLVLAHDLSVGLVSKRASVNEVTDDGEITVVAPVDGVVAEIDATQGGFIQAGEVVATLHEAGTTRVDAQMLLDPADFARIEKGSYVRIVLPDQTEVPGEVASVAVQNTRNRAEATVSVVSPTLDQQAADELVLPGTPVVARVELRDDGPLAGPDLAFQRFLQRLGL
ncbi:HlyD family secretion protein [Isoptericola jiangsuensis]|uniref:HlyD family secretion protein n=1 Tax=Isoptericola jiangsuensis TaxID=548579 RepID=A0A2A9EZF2_9MICO|nr:HlyD family secretion protein [Isoptericola jiangsuensis]PFG44527.1 HlyD family secretion protein [Isoptericola jiangsuensis]